MAHRSFVAAAFVGLGLISCGGVGEAADPGAPALDQHTTGNPNQPVSNSQRPAPNPNQAAGNPQSGSSPSDPGSVDIAALCNGYCTALIDCTGMGESLEAQAAVVQCALLCLTGLAAGPQCVELVAAHQACIQGIGQTCTFGDTLSGVVSPGCEGEDSAIEECAGVVEDDCTLEAGCVCGGDACEICRCGAADDTTCDPLCVATN